MSIRRYILPALAIWLLVSCNIGDWNTPEPAGPSYPDKTSDGHDFLVCMVNNNLELEVYQEQREMLFGSEEVRADYYSFSVDELNIYARKNFENNSRTEIELRLKEGNPTPNTTYNISATYSGWSGEFNADESSAIIRFSRIDSLVAAGEFAFIGVDQNNDSMTFRGYFDIPFADK